MNTIHSLHVSGLIWGLLSNLHIYCERTYINVAMLKSIQFRGIHYIHRVVPPSCFQNFLTTPKGNSITIEQELPILPASPQSPWEPLIHSLSVRMCLLQMFRVSGSAHYLPLCVWVISLSIMLLSFTHIAAGVTNALNNGLIILRY